MKIASLFFTLLTLLAIASGAPAKTKESSCSVIVRCALLALLGGSKLIAGLTCPVPFSKLPVPLVSEGIYSSTLPNSFEKLPYSQLNPVYLRALEELRQEDSAIADTEVTENVVASMVAKCSQE